MDGGRGRGRALLPDARPVRSWNCGRPAVMGRPPPANGLAGFPPIAGEEAKKGGAGARRVRHRRRSAEPDPPPNRLAVQEEGAALRALLNLPPSERG